MLTFNLKTRNCIYRKDMDRPRDHLDSSSSNEFCTGQLLLITPSWSCSVVFGREFRVPRQGFAPYQQALPTSSYRLKPHIHCKLSEWKVAALFAESRFRRVSSWKTVHFGRPEEVQQRKWSSCSCIRIRCFSSIESNQFAQEQVASFLGLSKWCA